MLVKIIFLAIIFSVNAADLPKYLLDLKCPVDEHIKECFIKNGNLAIPLVAKGDEEYGLPKMNPLEIPFIRLISTPALLMNLTDLKIYGLENMKIQDIRLNFDEGVYTMVLKADNLTLHGEYSVDGKVLVMPIKGQGHFSINAMNGVYKVTATSEYYEKDGDKYFRNTGGRLVFNQFDNIHFQFDNLFEGNEKLGAQVNKFLNENWDILVDDFGPGIGEIITDKILQIYRAFTSNIPVKNFYIFP